MPAPQRGRKLVTLNGCKSEFRCPFHGMSWNTDGSFKENPFSWDFPQWQGRDMSLPEVKVETWGGFVFINFDPAAAPLMDTLQPLADHFDRYDFASRYKAAHTSKVVPCNWKVMAEAFNTRQSCRSPGFIRRMAGGYSGYGTGTKLIDRSRAGLPKPVPLLAESPSRSMSILGTTGSDFDGGKSGLTNS